MVFVQCVCADISESALSDAREEWDRAASTILRAHPQAVPRTDALQRPAHGPSSTSPSAAAAAPHHAGLREGGQAPSVPPCRFFDLDPCLVRWACLPPRALPVRHTGGREGQGMHPSSVTWPACTLAGAGLLRGSCEQGCVSSLECASGLSSHGTPRAGPHPAALTLFHLCLLPPLSGWQRMLQPQDLGCTGATAQGFDVVCCSPHVQASAAVPAFLTCSCSTLARVRHDKDSPISCLCLLHPLWLLPRPWFLRHVKALTDDIM